MIENQARHSGIGFRTRSETLSYETHQAPQFLDITEDVIGTIGRSGVTNGAVVIFSRHTTAAVKINEHEPHLLEDMGRFLTDLAPVEREYMHNDFDVRTVNMEEDERPNAHSHCQHLTLSASETVPIVDGLIHLGRWQRIFLVELDSPKPRQVTVQVLGI